MGDEQTADRRNQIIEAAFQVFSRKGFKGATNREIAAEAGITPGLLYWYFQNKEDLFQAVIDSRSVLPPILRLTGELFDAPPREFFTKIAAAVFGVIRQEAVLSAVRFLFAEALRAKHIRDILATRVVARALEHVARYIEHQVELGRMRKIDPITGARLFMGLLFSQAMLGPIMELESTVPIETIVTEAVELFLRGVDAQT